MGREFPRLSTLIQIRGILRTLGQNLLAMHAFLISAIARISLVQCVLYSNSNCFSFMTVSRTGYYRRWPDWSSCFFLEFFAYLTGLVTANHKAGSNSAGSYIANRQEAWFDLNHSACSGAIAASVIIGCDQPSQICTRLKKKAATSIWSPSIIP